MSPDSLSICVKAFSPPLHVRFKLQVSPKGILREGSDQCVRAPLPLSDSIADEPQCFLQAVAKVTSSLSKSWSRPSSWQFSRTKPHAHH